MLTTNEENKRRVIKLTQDKTTAQSLSITLLSALIAYAIAFSFAYLIMTPVHEVVVVLLTIWSFCGAAILNSEYSYNQASDAIKTLKLSMQAGILGPLSFLTVK